MYRAYLDRWNPLHQNFHITSVKISEVTPVVAGVPEHGSAQWDNHNTHRTKVGGV